jgi:hypothetical protein
MQSWEAAFLCTAGFPANEKSAFGESTSDEKISENEKDPFYLPSVEIF